MLSKKHIVVLQNLKSRFPVVKVVLSTSAETIIPNLAEIYNAYDI